MANIYTVLWKLCCNWHTLYSVLIQMPCNCSTLYFDAILINLLWNGDDMRRKKWFTTTNALPHLAIYNNFALFLLLPKKNLKQMSVSQCFGQYRLLWSSFLPSNSIAHMLSCISQFERFIIWIFLEFFISKNVWRTHESGNRSKHPSHQTLRYNCDKCSLFLLIPSTAITKSKLTFFCRRTFFAVHILRSPFFN